MSTHEIEAALADYRRLLAVAEERGIDPAGVQAFIDELERQLALRQAEQDPRRN